MIRNTFLGWTAAVVLALLCFIGNAQAEKPKVLLLGDSITMHYSPFVIELTSDQADVYRCNQNSTWTGRLLKESLASILDAEKCKWDVVWFNVGNWDITPADARFIRKNPDWGFTAGNAKTSLEDYQKNLGELVRRIREHSPGAKLIFSTTTYIPSVGAKTVEQYNKAAIQVMNKNEVPVFDLYSVTRPHVELLLYKDNTHFSSVANQRLLAPRVASALTAFLENGSLPATGKDALSIPKEMIPALEKERDLGHPKHRGKKKK
ncbi:MAG: SGNH/GDSL hydrolase family protein [Planctomycetales bacterium]